MDGLFVVLLFYCFVVLLFCCFVVLLFCCFVVLLFCSSCSFAPAPLHFRPYRLCMDDEQSNGWNGRMAGLLLLGLSPLHHFASLSTRPLDLDLWMDDKLS